MPVKVAVFRFMIVRFQGRQPTYLRDVAPRMVPGNLLSQLAIWSSGPNLHPLLNQGTGERTQNVLHYAKFCLYPQYYRLSRSPLPYAWCVSEIQ